MTRYLQTNSVAYPENLTCKRGILSILYVEHINALTNPESEKFEEVGSNIVKAGVTSGLKNAE